jgi:hypothetical protein
VIVESGNARRAASCQLKADGRNKNDVKADPHRDGRRSGHAWVIEQEGTAMAAVPSPFPSTGNKETFKDNEA